MNAPAGNERLRIENDFLRALLVRLRSVTPREGLAGTMLEEARPVFDPSGHPEDAPAPRLETDEDLDAIAVSLRRSPRATALRCRQEQAFLALHAMLQPSGRTWLRSYEKAHREHADLLQSIVFAYAFRLGQLWPAWPSPLPTEEHVALRRLVRAATDLRSPPGQRLRVLLAASVQALEELYSRPVSP